MSKKFLIATCLTVLTVTAANAGKLPFPVAADGTTNIADCGKVSADYRNECISRARPVTGKQIYAAQPKAEKATPVQAVKAAAAKTTTIVKKAVAAIVAPKGPRGYKVAKDGTTNIYDCAKARADVRDDCIRRSRPLTGKQLAKFEKVSVKAPKAVAAAAPKAAVAPKAPVVPAVVVAKTPGKGFTVAKDGTTDINSCSKANPEYRDECISRARPVKGAEIYRALKSKS